MAYRSTGTGVAGTGTSAAVPVPSGVAALDIITVGLYIEGNTETITAPSGFTQNVAQLTNPTTRGRLYMFWKRATAGDTGTYSFTWTTSNVYEAVAIAHSGAIRTGDPFDVTGSAASADTVGTTQVGSVTTSVYTSDLVVFGSNHATNAGAWTPPSGMTERYDNSGSGTAHLNANTQDSVSAGLQSKTITSSGTTGNSVPKIGMGALIPETATLRASSSGAPASAAAFATTLPTHESGDRLIIVVQGKYDTATIPTIDQGFTLVGSGTGGTGSAAADTGTIFTAVYAKDASSSSETAPTVTPGGTAPNTWVWSAHSLAPATGKTWVDSIAGSADWVQFASDTNTATPLTGTAGAYSGQPTLGDAILVVGSVPSDSPTNAGTATTVTATGLSNGRVRSATTQFVKNALGDDFFQGWATFESFGGTASAGVAVSMAPTLSSNFSGHIVAIALRQGVGTPQYAAAGTVAAVSAVSSGAAGLNAVAAGTVAGTSAVTSGAAGLNAVASGTVAGTSVATGAASRGLPASGTVAGTSAATGAATSLLTAAATVAATSVATGAATLRAVAAGIVEAVTDVAGTITSALLDASGIVDAISGVRGAGVVPQPPVDTPPERTLYVTAESRALVVAAENRTLTIAAENRTLAIAAENRTLGVGP